MKKVLWICVLAVPLSAGCEDDIETERIGDTVVEYHDEYIAVRFD